MLAPSPRIAWIGVGAAGGYYAAKLARAGFDVHLLLRSDYDVIRTQGLQIKSVDGDFHLPAQSLHCYDDPRQMPKCDLVVITLKTTANARLKELISPLVGEQTCLLTLQNGLGNEEALAELFGQRHVLGGMMFVCIVRDTPGIINHIERGHIRIGDLSGPATERTRQIAKLFLDSGVRCEAIDDLKRGRWEKLVWNIPFNGLGAALLASTDVLLAHADGQSLVREIMHEVLAIAAADDIDLPESLIDHNIRVTYPMGAYRTSMQIDRENGRPMEIEAIIGHPLSIARQKGINTPCISWLHRLLNCVC
jgi:2-dehydropantoate 2-reductase